MEFKLLKNTFGFYNALDIEKYIIYNKHLPVMKQLVSKTIDIDNTLYFNWQFKYGEVNDYAQSRTYECPDMITKYKYDNHKIAWRIIEMAIN